MDSAGCRHGATENGRRRAAPDAVAMMRSLEVVERNDRARAAVERCGARELVRGKAPPPMFGENRLLQTLDEAVGPSVARLDAGVTDPERPTRRGELGFELAAP